MARIFAQLQVAHLEDSPPNIKRCARPEAEKPWRLLTPGLGAGVDLMKHQLLAVLPSIWAAPIRAEGLVVNCVQVGRRGRGTGCRRQQAAFPADLVCCGQRRRWPGSSLRDLAKPALKLAWGMAACRMHVLGSSWSGSLLCEATQSLGAVSPLG